MADNLIVESIGTIAKEEKIATVDYKIIENTLVLETMEPFPGYHHNVPKAVKPTYLFLVTKKYYTREDIARASAKIKQYWNVSFDAASAELSIFNDRYSAIRIKDLESYEQIEDLQQCFKNEDIRFRKIKKINSKGIIKVKKFFVLKDIAPEGIYFDQLEPHFIYIKIPRKLSWKLFEKITYSLKNNWDAKDFDAAIGTIFRRGNVDDVIRIYCEHFNLDELKLIRDKYLKEIEKYL